MLSFFQVVALLLFGFRVQEGEQVKVGCLGLVEEDAVNSVPSSSSTTLPDMHLDDWQAALRLFLRGLVLLRDCLLLGA